MSTIQKIESAVEKLSKSDFKKFRNWFDDYEANNWDLQFEHDIKNDKLNKIAKQVIDEFENGKCSVL